VKDEVWLRGGCLSRTTVLTSRVRSEVEKRSSSEVIVEVYLMTNANSSQRLICKAIYCQCRNFDLSADPATNAL